MTSHNPKKKVFLNSFFITVQTVIDKFIFFIINILIARYLDTSLFGEYTTSLAYATFFSTFTDIGINSTLVRSIMKDHANSNEHITNAFILKSLLSLFVYCSMALSLFFMNYSPTVIKLILIFGFVRIGNEYMNLFYAIYSAQERFVIQAINNSLFSLSILLSTVVVIIVKESYFAFAFTRFAIVAVFIFILARLTLKNITLKFSIRSLKVFLPQAYYFGLGSIYSNLLQRVNIIILSYMHGTLLSGFFSNAYMIFVTLFFIPTNLNKVLISHLYNFTYNEAPHKFQFAFDVYSKFFDIIAVGLAMPIFIFSSEIIVAIYGKNYLPAANILKITALAIPFLFNVSGIMLSAIDKQYVRTKCQKYSVMVNIVSCAILIFYFKGEGAAIATLATYLFLNFSYNMALKKFTTIRYYTSLLNKIKIFAIGLLLCSLVIQLHPQCHFLITTLALLISYCFFVYIFTITIKDLEVMRDIFGKIVPRKKYIFF